MKTPVCIALVMSLFALAMMSVATNGADPQRSTGQVAPSPGFSFVLDGTGVAIGLDLPPLVLRASHGGECTASSASECETVRDAIERFAVEAGATRIDDHALVVTQL